MLESRKLGNCHYCHCNVAEFFTHSLERIFSGSVAADFVAPVPSFFLLYLSKAGAAVGLLTSCHLYCIGDHCAGCCFSSLYLFLYKNEKSYFENPLSVFVPGIYHRSVCCLFVIYALVMASEHQGQGRHIIFSKRCGSEHIFFVKEKVHV